MVYDMVDDTDYDGRWDDEMLFISYLTFFYKNSPAHHIKLPDKIVDEMVDEMIKLISFWQSTIYHLINHLTFYHLTIYHLTIYHLTTLTWNIYPFQSELSIPN